MHQYSDVLNECIADKRKINDIKSIFSLCARKSLRVVHQSVSPKNVNMNTKAPLYPKVYRVHSLISGIYIDLFLQ